MPWHGDANKGVLFAATMPPLAGKDALARAWTSAACTAGTTPTSAGNRCAGEASAALQMATRKVACGRRQCAGNPRRC